MMMESIAFVYNFVYFGYNCIQKYSLSIWDYSRKFDCWMIWVCWFDEPFCTVFTSVPQRKDIANVTFPNGRFYDALANNLCFNVGHKNVCKSKSPWQYYGFGGSSFHWIGNNFLWEWVLAFLSVMGWEWECFFCENYCMLCILNLCPPHVCTGDMTATKCALNTSSNTLVTTVFK